MNAHRVHELHEGLTNRSPHGCTNIASVGGVRCRLHPVIVARPLNIGGKRGSSLLVGVENVVLRLHGSMARVSAV